MHPPHPPLAYQSGLQQNAWIIDWPVGNLCAVVNMADNACQVQPGASVWDRWRSTRIPAQRHQLAGTLRVG